MTPEKQNTSPEEDSAKKLEKEAQEKKDLEGMFSSENNNSGGENLTGEEKIDRTKAVNLITEKIHEKSKNINDPTTQTQIDALIKEMSAFNKPGILSPEEKTQLSEMYQEIEKLHGTEHAENAKAGEAAKELSKASQKEYAQKLLESTEKLTELLKKNIENKLASQNEIKNLEKKEAEGNPPPDLDKMFPMSELLANSSKEQQTA